MEVRVQCGGFGMKLGELPYCGIIFQYYNCKQILMVSGEETHCSLVELKGGHRRQNLIQHPRLLKLTRK